MEINKKKNYLSLIGVYFIMLLFVMCLTMNVFFCSTYNFYESLDKTTVNETWAISESIVANEDSDDISSILMTADIQKGISVLLFLIIVFLFFFLTLFILLPDRWTLINQKVRLDN